VGDDFRAPVEKAGVRRREGGRGGCSSVEVLSVWLVTLLLLRLSLGGLVGGFWF
jgi:hypothetical protein